MPSSELAALGAAIVLATSRGSLIIPGNATLPPELARLTITTRPHSSSHMPLWLHWIILGLVAGALAKFLVPGRDPAGCIITIALGIMGSLLGGWIASLAGWGDISQSSFAPRSIAVATVGAVAVLLIGRLLVRYKP